MLTGATMHGGWRPDGAEGPRAPPPGAGGCFRQRFGGVSRLVPVTVQGATRLCLATGKKWGTNRRWSKPLDFGLVVQTTFTGGPNHEIENLVNP